MIVVLFVFVITLLGVDKYETFDEPSRSNARSRSCSAC